MKVCESPALPACACSAVGRTNCTPAVARVTDEIGSTVTWLDTAAVDPIADAIESFAVDERRRNFHFLARNSHIYMNGEDLSVFRASPERTDQRIDKSKVDPASLSGCIWYTFFQPLWSLKDTVPIRCLTPPGATGQVTVNDMEVLDIDDTKSWMPLCAWMRTQFEWHDECDWKQRGGPQLQLESMFPHYPSKQYCTDRYLILPDQITWWDNNGKHFDFFKLPLEMRQLLYLEFLGGGIILPQVRSKVARSRSVTFGHGDKTVPKDRVGSKIDPDIVHPDPKILLVCRQTYHEAKDAVWTCATKRFSSTSSFTRLNISQIRLHGHPKALNRVQLELPAAHYFELIGIRPRFGAPFAPMFAGDQAVALGLLKSFNTVKYLDFRFISPKHERAICPWGSIPRRAASSQEHSCQKVWIDWFFTLAFEHLLGWICKSHNEENKITSVKTIITMSGCIKKSTRDKWETIFSAEHKLKIHGGPPSFLDQMKDAAVEIRKTKQDDLPIKCDCTYPCSATNIPENGYVRFADSDLRRHVAGLEEAIQEIYFSFKD